MALPDGWTEQCDAYGYRYMETIDAETIERVFVHGGAVTVVPKPYHWPEIPLEVLQQAALRCWELRRQGWGPRAALHGGEAREGDI